MSALTEKVAKEHWAWAVGMGVPGRCLGCNAPVNSTHEHVAHIAEVTEQAVRANVAAEIRALDDGEPRSPDALNAIDHAADIAEGKQP